MVESDIQLIKKQHTPMASLQREVNWHSEEKPYLPEKEKNSSLKFGLIGAERLYRGLDYEGEMTFLTENNWQFALKYKQLDFVLIESCLETATGDWSLALTEPNFEDSELYQLIERAKEKKIPTVYWFTLDHEYHELFSPVAKYFDYVFCADPIETDKLNSVGIEASTLLPAFQPAIYNPVKEGITKERTGSRIISNDSINTLLKDDTWKVKSEFLSRIGTVFFDSENKVNEVISDSLFQNKLEFFGTISGKDYAYFLKSPGVYIWLGKDGLSSSVNGWKLLEAAASGRVIVSLSKIKDDLGLEIISAPNDYASILTLLNNDSSLMDIRSQKTLLRAFEKHTFSHRIEELCRRLGIVDFVEEVAEEKVSVVTPTNRMQNIEHLLGQFSEQSYKNKELVIVFNGDYQDYNKVCKIVLSKGLDNLIVKYMPSIKSTGECMNVGIRQANGEYIYKFDDDDYYGKNYISASIHLIKLTGAMVWGKVFSRFIYMKDNGEHTVYERNSPHLKFQKPALVSLDENMYLSGAAFGGKRNFLIANPYPMNSYGSVDADHRESIRKNNFDGFGLVLDDTDYIVERREGEKHTWNMSEVELLKNTKKIGYTVSEFFFRDDSFIAESSERVVDNSKSFIKGRIVLITPVRFGSLGTPGAYKLALALSKKYELLVIANNGANYSSLAPNVLGDKGNIHQIEINFGHSESMKKIADIVSDFQADIVHINNFRRWSDLAQSIKKNNVYADIFLDIKTPLLAEGDAREVVQKSSNKGQEYLSGVFSRAYEDVQSWFDGDIKIPYFGYPLGISINDFPKFEVLKTLGMKNHSLKLVYIGTLHEKRELNRLIRFIGLLPEAILSKITFDIYGSGRPEDVELLQGVIEDNYLNNIVFIHEPVSQDELFSTLGKYDVGVAWVPRQFYNFAPSLKFLEYAGMGLSILATNTTGHRRNLENGFAAVTFVDDDFDSFSQAIDKLLLNKATVIDRQINYSLLKKYDWDQIVDSYFKPVYDFYFEKKLASNEDLLIQSVLLNPVFSQKLFLFLEKTLVNKSKNYEF